jgi:hypothetical protein
MEFKKYALLENNSIIIEDADLYINSCGRLCEVTDKDEVIDRGLVIASSDNILSLAVENDLIELTSGEIYKLKVNQDDNVYFEEVIEDCNLDVDLAIWFIKYSDVQAKIKTLYKKNNEGFRAYPIKR